MPGRKGEDANLTGTSLVTSQWSREHQGSLNQITDPWGQFGEALTSPMMADEEWECGEG